MRTQRDIYANLNNEVLHHANQGVTINEIHNVYKPPKSLQQQWAARSYHGSEFHNSRAVINRYLGYWDGNPTTLVPLSPKESAPLFVEMMGGASKIIARGKSLYAAGKYRECTEIVNKLVYAEPANQDGKDLLADCFEQLGYQAESNSVRNSYLAGAYELRNGIPTGASPKPTSPDFVSAMSTDLFLDFLGVRLNVAKADGKAFTINLIHPDIGEKYVLELSNATLTNIKGYLAPRPDLTLSVDRADLERIMFGQTNLEELLKGGKARAEGNVQLLAELYGMLDTFSVGFEILPGTLPSPAPAAAGDKPLQQEAPTVVGE
jgi:alkyl sulfatase BDS1-like metallo-beta-lactamase superfamily hydrolase